ncbi:hypothetical protein DTW90_35685 [Neorhizobium sp. P12A]|nr:hypothetical protein DTW90_35685 [Neorhizobium sp. P12A]
MMGRFMLNIITRLFRPEDPRSTAQFPSLLFDSHFHEARHKVIIMADGAGATQRISFDLPLRARREKGDVALAIFQESAIASPQDMTALLSALRPTIVVASRFGGIGAEQIASYCRSASIPLITHFDDDLFDVPLALGKAKYDRYHDRTRQQNMRLLCEAADCLYLSTEQLKSRFEMYKFGPQMVAGEIYCPIPDTIKRGLSNKKLFGYMGTAGHAEDLQQVLPAIETALNRIPDLSFETFGSIKMPMLLQKKFGNRVRSIAPTADYSAFLQRMRELDWMVGLAPLERNSFNDCKADTKFIEYVSAGILPVPATGPVYSRICAATGVPQLDNELWGERIYELMSGPHTEASRFLGDIQDRLTASYSLSMLEKQVADILMLDG